MNHPHPENRINALKLLLYTRSIKNASDTEKEDK
jgi:hypothetical protein